MKNKGDHIKYWLSSSLEFYKHYICLICSISISLKKITAPISHFLEILDKQIRSGSGLLHSTTVFYRIGAYVGSTYSSMNGQCVNVPFI